ncbi:Retrovirus-related Pol polyprotein from transposon TNT 1-94 [Morus notabilis]|uniref:Retrovirus-related Pol polyprotein from transposon TNT 1-94 n=1 Tax=Morus notabilis TaxID=981085 RepID=W9RZ97_9ROSA|nr:Retrovirus-related Pol polyprotein from transposon TNT 1-94 [Morus notabilis]
MTKMPFTAKGVRATEPLQLIHSDVCGLLNVQVRGAYEYYATFIDDYSRYGYVYLMQRKSETFGKFREFRAEVEKQLGKPIKTPRSDREGEYMDQEFRDFLIEEGVVSQLTAPGTPQQNGVAERRNRTLLDMIRSMLSYSSLPTSFWGHALKTAIPAHVLRQKTGKLEPRSEVYIFVGYPQGTRGGLFYSQADQKVFVSTNATFLEHDYMIDFKPRSKIVLEELLSDEIRPQPTRVVGPLRQKTIVPDQTLMAPRRSRRVSRLPDRYTGEAQIVTADDGKEDPSTFRDAMDDSNKEEWQAAMKLEIESMHSNSVWQLVDLPEGVKPIRCKWIYKRKRGVDGKVETYKARLVAKGYTQKEGVDYEETFSPVAMLKSIRILLAIAAYFDYEIWQMDVKTPFLNGYLDETIYMDQLEG